MATVTPPQVHTDEDFEREHRRNRGLIITVIILAIVAIGLGAALFYQIAMAETLPSEVEEALDDYIGAWESADTEAFLASVTDDYMITEYIYAETGVSADPLKFSFKIYDDDPAITAELGVSGSNYTVERGDAIVVMGDGPWIVSFEETWTTGPTSMPGVATYLVEMVDGQALVSNHSWTGYSSLIDF